MWYPHRPQNSQTPLPTRHHSPLLTLGIPHLHVCVHGRAWDGYGHCSSFLPPTSILAHWLVPSAPHPIRSCPPVQPPPVPPIPVDAAVGSSWAGAGSHLELTPSLVSHKMFKKVEVCVQRHQKFAQTQINKTPHTSSPKLIFAALGKYR